MRGFLNDWFYMMQLGFVSFDCLNKISISRYLLLWKQCYIRKVFKS